MIGIEQQLEKTKLLYRKFFLEFSKELDARILKLKPEGLNGEISDSYAPDSLGSKWQEQVRNLLQDEIAPEIYKNIYKLKNSKTDLCKMCGSCCKLAISEFSQEELIKKACEGDNFAKQFISVFVQYKIEDIPRNIFPEYIDYLALNGISDVYFYYCPLVTEDNRCSDYENRPQICRDFPDNPFSLLPPSCGYCKWKESILSDSLKYQAMSEIVKFYKNLL